MNIALRMFIMMGVMVMIPYLPINLLPKVVILGLLGLIALAQYLCPEKGEIEPPEDRA